MKINKYFSLLFTLFLAFAFNSFAQQEMTEDEWQAEMGRLKTKNESLNKEVSTLQTDVNGLKSNLSSLQSYDDCIGDLYQMVGATKADIDNFRKAVNELEGKIRRKEAPKADRQKDLNALKANKISALPEFYTKIHVMLQNMLTEWEDAPKDISYVVVKGDCLWNIAKKKDHYGNGFAWPKIYNANRDQIKNPDLIYPKQTFKIPPLTPEEKDKYDKAKKNYKPAPTQ